MATNVTVVTFGGEPEILNDVATVADIVAELDLDDGYQVKVNGVTAAATTTLADYAHVSFGEAVKGGI